MHALACLDQDEIDQAIAGFEFFGLTGTVDLLRSLRHHAIEEAEQSTDARYTDDASIEAAFRQCYGDRPGLFAPPR